MRLKWAGAAIAAAMLLAASAVFAQQHSIHLVVRQTAASSLTLISPTDPAFDSTLDSYFPGISEEHGYQQAIRPFLVFVQNNTNQPAVAYAITWTPRQASGWASPLLMVAISRPFLRLQSTTNIRPGGLRLISPLFNLTAAEYSTTSSFAQVYPASRFPALHDGTSPVASVDGVVYGDGSFTGPDATKVLERYVMAGFAARDEALDALNFIRSSIQSPLLGQQMLGSFAQEVHNDWGANQGTLLAWYVRARARSAQDLSGILSSQGIGGLQTVLEAFLSRSGRDENPSMFDKSYRSLSKTDPRVFGPVPWNLGQS